MSANRMTVDLSGPATGRLPWARTGESCPDCGDDVVLVLDDLGDTSVECGCGSVLVLT